ncbi:hypothetical protein C8R44DRAFT_976684 [Mycena epipterygia]|nr:hypothetical protein C8R44DRAFT_976684 [Mycena epipterygia]
MASTSTSLVPKKSFNDASLQLLHRTDTLIRRGPGLTISQLAKSCGSFIEAGVNRGLNRVGGPEVYGSRIKKFFGESDHDKRQAALDELHTALQHAIGDSLSREYKALRDDCHKLLKYARPNSNSIDTQLVTFNILVSIITRYPGLRRCLADHKDLRNISEQDLENIWKREVQSCGEEWTFYRDFAAFCISESDLAKLVEAEKPSQLALVRLEGDTLNKVPIETLLGCCRDGPTFEPARMCAIQYLGEILALPSFWQKGGPDETRFFVVLSDVCRTMFQLLDDTQPNAADSSIDISPSISAARKALDSVCTVTFNGLLRLNETNCLPRHSPDRLPDIISRLINEDDMKACFPYASDRAPSVLKLFTQSFNAGNETRDSPSPIRYARRSSVDIDLLLDSDESDVSSSAEESELAFAVFDADGASIDSRGGGGAPFIFNDTRSTFSRSAACLNPNRRQRARSADSSMGGGDALAPSEMWHMEQAARRRAGGGGGGTQPVAEMRFVYAGAVARVPALVPPPPPLSHAATGSGGSYTSLSQSQSGHGHRGLQGSVSSSSGGSDKLGHGCPQRTTGQKPVLFSYLYNPACGR